MDTFSQVILIAVMWGCIGYLTVVYIKKRRDVRFKDHKKNPFKK
jgi:hypothetical protein